MRITDKMRFNTTRSDLNRLQNRSSRVYKELSSGKKINRPSDDPFGALQATGLQTHRRLLEQYSRNIDTARINLYAADNALGQAVTSITSARSTLISAVSVLGDPQSHEVMADTMSQIKEQILNLANSRVGDTYIFAGFQSTRKPYTVDTTSNRVSYRGDQGAMQLEIGEGSLVQSTLEGASAFGGGSQTAVLSAGSGYTGQPVVVGEYNGSLGNVDVTVEVIAGGDPQSASYQIEINGVVDDNGGVGYTLDQLNTRVAPGVPGPLGNLGVQLSMVGNNSAFNVGDQVNLQLVQSDHEDVFALFDELELALRQSGELAVVGAVDYDGNGISDLEDLDIAEQVIRDHNNSLDNPLPDAPGGELQYMIGQARKERFGEISTERFQRLLGRLDKALNQVSDHQSLVGLGLNKVDSADAANEFLNEQVTTTLAHVEDSDFMEAVSELNLVETALQATTSTTSRVLQGISLLDYLR
jgi:flagellar hook-associated protein 3 FlgL